MSQNLLKYKSPMLRKPKKRKFFLTTLLQIFISDCLEITKNKYIKDFQYWGAVFNVTFTINISESPSSDWLNVFQFTNSTDSSATNIPALYINKDQKLLEICSAVNGSDFCWITKPQVFNQQHQMGIAQFKNKKGEFWYQITVDGEIKLEVCFFTCSKI